MWYYWKYNNADIMMVIGKVTYNYDDYITIYKYSAFFPLYKITNKYLSI